MRARRAVETERAVDGLVERAVRAGATLVAEPGPKPSGYESTVSGGHLRMVNSSPG